jgi:signal transduction histidine kinase
LTTPAGEPQPGTGEEAPERRGMAGPEQKARLLSRVIDTLGAGLGLDEVVQAVADLVTESTDTDICFVHLLDEDGRRLRLRGATPPFDQLAGSVELALGEGVSGWVAEHREPVVISDNKRADPRYRYIPALRGEEFVSMASVPITTANGELVGVFNVHTRTRRDFTEADTELLRSVAALVAGAIENARLHRRLAEREEALERFAERMVELQETERRRLAGEVHDGISQRIVGLSFHLSAAADAVTASPAFAEEQVRSAQHLADAALEETRLAIAGLRPPVLDDLGLAASLESLVRSVPSEEVDIDVDAEACELPEHLETAIYRIAQEALQNVVKHAGAERAEVRLRETEGGVVLEDSDDGQGFDVSALPTGGGRPVGYGLTGMRERAELVGAHLQVDTAKGAGTQLRLTVPRNGKGEA